MRREIAEYISAYQFVLQRFTDLVIIYSAIGIFLIPVCQDIFKREILNSFMIGSFIVFWLLFASSVYYAIRLIIPYAVGYLTVPSVYYKNIRLKYEQMVGSEEVLDIILQISYISELEFSLEVNRLIYLRKSSFYIRALRLGLLSAVPFIVCLIFHIIKNEQNAQVSREVETKKFSNFPIQKKN
ncbi:hypothetical protein DVR12_06325 [Chitinophaga silvatica]|uniref:Uncharacterized protein n=1 Tax=Chitinophaga silvatica TaxID=2282649 RepID=A0A3E1YET7_9BACT|nr:hypothetical protein [Chitinophaga silvatica]RFS24807.1 hypothetical protein DVR12_06325 [Chitinophaga silvatica]